MSITLEALSTDSEAYKAYQTILYQMKINGLEIMRTRGTRGDNQCTVYAVTSDFDREIMDTAFRLLKGGNEQIPK